MLGKYSAESVKDISSDRTEKAIRLIKELGGEVSSMFGLLGKYDCCLIVDFGNNETAMRASLGLTILTGISFISYPAVAINDFDRMLSNRQSKAK